MLCQECRKNEATIHIVKNIYGRQVELNLCENCARKKEELDFTFEPQFSLHKLFASMLNQGLFNGSEVKSVSNLKCPGCGFTFTQFSQVGRLGCSECFKAFEGKLKPLLRRIHAGTVHKGKVPAGIAKRVHTIREIDSLKEDLQQKVQDEEFEEAALIRDRIRSIEAAIKENSRLAEAGQDDSEQGENQ